jgi:hypothetical protein
MSDVKFSFTAAELFLAIDEHLNLMKQKPDLTKVHAELMAASNDYLNRLGMKPHLTVIDEVENKK